MSERLRTYLPFWVAFTLPLGFLGVLGVAGLILFFLLTPLLTRSSWTLAAAGLPLALITVASAALSPSPAECLPPAVGLAVLYTLGLATIHSLTLNTPGESLIQAFILGTVLLAFSVMADSIFGWRNIPSGLFWQEGLHNWTATSLVLAFPLSLHLALRYQVSPRSRGAGIAVIILLLLGVALSLSWVGAIGLVVGTLTYLLLRWPKSSGLFLVSTAFLIWALAGMLQAGFATFQLGGYSLANLGDVFFGRLRIFAEGLEMASLRPVIGWGYSVGRISPILEEHGIGAYYVDDLALPHFHSLYVQTLFENGVLGFAALLFLIAFLFLRQRGTVSVAIRAAIVGFAAVQMFDFSWAQSSLILSVWLVASIGQPAKSDGQLSDHRLASSRALSATQHSPSVLTETMMEARQE